MNIKSLLLGTAAALVAVSGARAADANLLAEPEPVEYVRVCDVYGKGYFYIPGTETCLKVGGYYRFDVGNIAYDSSTKKNVGYTTRSRFAPHFTAKSETELGTLTGYSRIYAEYETRKGGGDKNKVELDKMYVTLATAHGTFLVGRNDVPYERFFDGAGPTLKDGYYADRSANEISYTFKGGNGFEAILAALDNPESSTWDTNFEGGVRIAQDWGMLGAMAGYDGVEQNWGAKAVARYNVPNSSAELMLMGLYSSKKNAPGDYTIMDPAGSRTEWSVIGGASVALTEKMGLATTVQWFDTDKWFVAVGAPVTPVAGLTITPEVYYDTATKDVAGIIRFQRSF